MDGAALHGTGSHGRHDSERYGFGRAAEVLFLRYHLRHKQRIRLRLPARQHANRRPRRRSHYPKQQQQAQGPLHFAIIDEVDNILIDEARTPLIISGPAEDDVTKYTRADKVARQLKKDVHFEVKEKEHTANLTDEGVREAERLAGVESFYTAGNMQWPHLIDNSLKAHHLYKRDVNYVVQDGEVVIVDEFTGRLMPGRHWSDGLHQAVEAKEGVTVKEESQTLATITLQNFFKLYDKICGMTGTALTEAGEFWKIYKLDVIGVPTNKPLKRTIHPDVIYRSEPEKFTAIADEIERLNRYTSVQLKDGTILSGTIRREDDNTVELQLPESKQTEVVPRDKIKEYQAPGRPVLVGTVSIEKSERLSGLLDRRGIKHEVLNAKHHKREAEIVAQAGRKGAVTIATNMAGRGTDIILGGNPETMAWAQLQDKYATRLDVPAEEWHQLVADIEHREGMKTEGQHVKEIGGLHIIGTERHEARRIDLQLRGRCGRQGDPGSSRFYLSLEDDLMRIFAGEWVKNLLTRLGMQEGEAIESRMVSRRIEGRRAAPAFLFRTGTGQPVNWSAKNSWKRSSRVGPTTRRPLARRAVLGVPRRTLRPRAGRARPHIRPAETTPCARHGPPLGRTEPALQPRRPVPGHQRS